MLFHDGENKVETKSTLSPLSFIDFYSGTAQLYVGNLETQGNGVQLQMFLVIKELENMTKQLLQYFFKIFIH